MPSGAREATRRSLESGGTIVERWGICALCCESRWEGAERGKLFSRKGAHLTWWPPPPSPSPVRVCARPTSERTRARASQEAHLKATAALRMPGICPKGAFVAGPSRSNAAEAAHNSRAATQPPSSSTDVRGAHFGRADKLAGQFGAGWASAESGRHAVGRGDVRGGGTPPSLAVRTPVDCSAAAWLHGCMAAWLLGCLAIWPHQQAARTQRLSRLARARATLVVFARQLSRPQTDNRFGALAHSLRESLMM